MILFYFLVQSIASLGVKCPPFLETEKLMTHSKLYATSNTLFTKIFRTWYLMILFHPHSLVDCLHRLPLCICPLSFEPNVSNLRRNNISLIIIFHIVAGTVPIRHIVIITKIQSNLTNILKSPRRPQWIIDTSAGEFIRPLMRRRHKCQRRLGFQIPHCFEVEIRAIDVYSHSSRSGCHIIVISVAGPSSAMTHDAKAFDHHAFLERNDEQ
mmetsp:Transcript_19689/g.41333  ORF Transcript_19689/g.41333 Transcript_19689/m.41333 type:complete len:211 (-) Transcript_19689:405-1037(-)